MKTDMQSTSLDTYFGEVKALLGEKQKVVLAAFDARESFTNSELADYLSWPINTITPRVFELRKLGRLAEDGKRVCARTGRKAIAWRRLSKPEQHMLCETNTADTATYAEASS